MKNVFECIGISKDYPNKAGVLTDINFEVLEGSGTIFLGENGSGKTTLLKIISGLLTPTAGRMIFLGENYSYSDDSIRKKIGYAPANEECFYPSGTVLDNLKFYAKLYGLSKTEVNESIQKWTKFFECDEYLTHSFQELSTGYKRRLTLVRAFLLNPKLVLLDEPLNALDKEYKIRILARICDWMKTEKCSFIMATHSQELLTDNRFQKIEF